VLELAVSPAILVSGIGLLLLSMTNRFGRMIDRARILMPRLGSDGGQRAGGVMEDGTVGRVRVGAVGRDPCAADSRAGADLNDLLRPGRPTFFETPAWSFSILVLAFVE